MSQEVSFPLPLGRAWRDSASDLVKLDPHLSHMNAFSPPPQPVVCSECLLASAKRAKVFPQPLKHATRPTGCRALVCLLGPFSFAFPFSAMNLVGDEGTSSSSSSNSSTSLSPPSSPEMFISGVLFSLFGSIMRPGVDSGRGRKLRGAWGLDQPVFQESRSSSSGSATLKELIALIVPRRAIVGQLDPSRDALPPPLSSGLEAGM